MMDQGVWEQIERDTLTATNAQRVYQILNNLESRRDRVQKRWIWELLQNALDASPNGQMNLTCSVRYEKEEVLLEHNGRPFEMQEIAHVIYHGSTKTEDKSKIGQYGSGLLTTHLLSHEIYISGKLVDGQEFNFPLRRLPTSVQAIDDCMKESAKKFQDSLSSVELLGLPCGITTRFQYSVEDEAATEVVAQGISSLEMLAPYILAFNQEFSSIFVQHLGQTAYFEITKREPSHNDYVQEVTVRQTSASNWIDSNYLLIQGGDTSIAVQVARVGDSTSCLQVGNVPRLFLGLPLIGTEEFSFPTVINSFQFTPSDEDRDGVNLWQNENDEANVRNQATISEACSLLVQLIRLAGTSGWENVFTLTEVPLISDKDWLNPEKLRIHLIENLLTPLLSTPVVSCQYANGILAPLEAILPYAEEEGDVKTLWDLLSVLKEYRSRLPRRKEVAGWNKAIQSWAKLSDCSATDFSGVVDGIGLARLVEETARGPENEMHGRIENIQDALIEGVCAVEWLNDILGFLKESKNADEIGSRYIILTQAGSVEKLANLFRDRGIDEDLKDIADEIDMCMREELLDRRLTTLGDEDGKDAKGNEEVVQEIIAKLKEIVRDGRLDDDFAIASARTFGWVTRNEEWDYLRGFPAFSQEDEDGDRDVVWLAPDGQNEEDIPLAPVSAWDEDLQKFAELFPPPSILATAFYEAESNAAAWAKLAEEHITRTSILVSNKKKLNRFLPDEPLPKLCENAVHETREAVALTNIIHLRGEGVIRRASRSLRRARLFWQLITEWLVVRDTQGLQTDDASCTCNASHKYYKGEWLLPLVDSNWVPLGNDRHTRATAQSLGRLFRDEEAFSIPNYDVFDRLLAAIRVSRFDLLRESMAVDDEARISVDNKLMEILKAAGNKPGRLDVVPRFLSQLSKDEALPDYLAERIKQTQTVHRNQQFGNLVECLVKESLECEGFLVEQTRVGADLVVMMAPDEAEDQLDDDATELKISKDDESWFVEVKATRTSAARMTGRQAREAVKRGQHFLLCVVPVHSEDDPDLDDVKDSMRFVGNIAERVSELCDELDKFEEEIGEISGEYSDGVHLTVTGGHIRVSIASSVWESDGFPLTDLYARLQA